MKNEMTMTESVADNTEYFAQRQLKKGAVGWLLLVGLGVSYVISGDFAGWNFGIAQGGWGGLFVATIVVAFMYLCMSLSMSEMSTMLPTAGGGYSFARVAFGQAQWSSFCLSGLLKRYKPIWPWRRRGWLRANAG